MNRKSAMAFSSTTKELLGTFCGWHSSFPEVLSACKRRFLGKGQSIDRQAPCSALPGPMLHLLIEDSPRAPSNVHAICRPEQSLAQRWHLIVLGTLNRITIARGTQHLSSSWVPSAPLFQDVAGFRALGICKIEASAKIIENSLNGTSVKGTVLLSTGTVTCPNWQRARRKLYVS